MNWLRLLAACAAVMVASPALAGTVGFQELQVADGAGEPLRVGVWYPSEAPAVATPLETFTQVVAVGAPVAGAAPLPLVVMSHGHGGWYGEHYDTALALAQAGFIVAALDHPHDTYKDDSRATAMIDRPRDLRRLVDFMTGAWPSRDHLDAGRIGAFGFSSGGFTVLVAVGGAPDMGKIAAHCAAHPDYYDCRVVQHAAGPPLRAAPPSAWAHDARIKAAVVVAPALGFTFGREGLANVHVPLQLWRATDDHILPHPDYAEAVRLGLPEPPDYRLAEHADHFDFLAPCSDTLVRYAPDICRSEAGFDRAAFHADFDREVTAFFVARLK